VIGGGGARWRHVASKMWRDVATSAAISTAYSGAAWDGSGDEDEGLGQGVARVVGCAFSIAGGRAQGGQGTRCPDRHKPGPILVH
jgi:hypothetical protein